MVNGGKDDPHQIGIVDIPTKLNFPLNPKSAQNEPGMCKGLIGPGNQVPNVVRISQNACD